MKKRKTKFIGVIGYNKFVKSNEDIFVPPEVYKNESARAYYVGCFPKVCHVLKSQLYFKSGRMNCYLNHKTDGIEIGYVTGVELLNRFTKDSSKLMSGLFNLQIYEDSYSKILKIFNVTSFHDVYWSLGYIIVWGPFKLIKGIKYKPIKQIIFKELSVTKHPRFRECITLIEGNCHTDSKTYHSMPIKKAIDPFNEQVILNYLRYVEIYNKSKFC